MRPPLPQRSSPRTPARRLHEAFVSPRTGLLHAVTPQRVWAAPDLLWAYQGLLADPRRSSGALANSSWLHSSGIGWSAEQALVVTIAEGVERHVAVVAGRAGPAACCGHPDLPGSIAPWSFAMPSDAERQRHDRVAAFEWDEPIRWIRGVRLPSGETSFGPMVLVCANVRPEGGLEGQLVAGAASTGTAVGGDRVDALLGGLCEVIERDAFITAHLHRLRVPEIALGDTDDPALAALLERVGRVGATVRAWDITTDIRVPSVLASATVDIDGEPAMHLGAATRPDARAAVAKAVLEAVQCTVWLSRDVVRSARAKDFGPGFAGVVTREDHIALGSRPDYQARLDWLLRDPPATRIDDLPDIGCPSDPAAELARALDAVAAVGLEAHAFDLTPEGVRAAGLEVWRTLVPGAQPLTFGKARCLRSERLHALPVRLGHARAARAEEDINLVPHCFP